MRSPDPSMSCTLSTATHGLRLGAVACLTLVLMGGCKNVVRDGQPSDSSPRHAADFSLVKFAAYSGGRVISAGEYRGSTTRSEVLDRAASDLSRQEPCQTGSSTAFCLTSGVDDGSEALEAAAPTNWIQLFMPDGSSCSVGPAPENAGIPSCLDRS